MKKLLMIAVLILFSAHLSAQDWKPVGMNFASITDKKIAVNDKGEVGMFVTNASSNAFFWVYDPISMTWSEIAGGYNAQTCMDINLVSKGSDFYFSYNTSAQQTMVWQLDATMNLMDVSAGLANSLFSIGATDMWAQQGASGWILKVGLNGDMTDVNVMKYTGSSWDTVSTDLLSQAGASINYINDVAIYANGTDIYLAVAYNNGTGNVIGLFSAPLGTGSFQWANGVPGPGTTAAMNIDIAGDGTGYPFIVCDNSAIADSVHFFEYDGAGFSAQTGTNFPGNTVLNVAASCVGPRKMVMATTDAAANATTVYDWSGGSLQNAHPSMNGLGFISDLNTAFAQHPVTGKPYVIVEEQTDQIQTYALNITPVVDNIILGSTCAFSYGYIVEQMDIKDDDDDSTWVNITSSSQTIIADNDIYEYFISRNGQVTSYQSDAYGSMDGTVDIVVVISDGIVTDTMTYQITVHPEPVLNSSVLTSYPVCNTSGPIDLNTIMIPSGGYWSGSAIDQNGLLDPVQAQQDPTVFYDYYDANGCYASDEINLTTFIGPEIQAVGTTPASCGNNDGSAEIQVIAGSTNDYFIQWSTGDTNVTVVSNLASGQYVINVVDTNSCENSFNYAVPSSDIVVSVTSSNPTCGNSTNGSIDITVTGNNAPFTYYWINGETTEDLTNVGAGFYSVYITDNIGCTTEEIIHLVAPAPISLDAWANDGQCTMNDGGVTISQVNGGVSPYTFLWSNAQTSQNLMNVAPGTYSVTVTDNANCTFNQSFPVSTYDGPYIYLDSNYDVHCNQNDGAIYTSIMTSQNPIGSILWSNSATTEDITGLAPGTYTIVATDVAGCEAHFTHVVKPVKPDVQPICLVTVDSLTTTNLLIWERVTLTGISHFNIYRETGAIGNYPLVGTVSASAESIWNDVNASPLTTSWRYKITQVDDCGSESNKSLHHKTMHVTINKGLGTTYNVFWDDYEGITYTSVNLYRYDQTNGIVVLATLPANVYSYTDDPGNDTLGLDYFVGFDLANACTSSRAQDYNGTRSNRSAGIFDPGNGVGLSVFENNDLSDQILIYPNPNNGEFTLQFGNTLVGEKKIRVIDARGKIVAYKKAFGAIYDLNMVHVEPGIYFVEVFNGNKKGVQKIVVQ